MARGQVVDVPIVSGLQQHEDPSLTAGLVQLRNGLYRKNGSIAKRYGLGSIDTANTILPTTSLSSASVDLTKIAPFARASIGAPDELAEFNGSLVRIGDGDVYTWSGQGHGWVYGGPASNVTVKAEYEASQAGGGVSDVTVVSCGNFLVHVYTARYAAGSSYAGLFVDVFDITTKAPVVQGRNIGQSTAAGSAFIYPVATVVGGMVFVSTWSPYVGGSGSFYQTIAFNPTTLAATLIDGMNTTVTLTASSRPYDLTNDGTYLYFAYTGTATGGATRVRKLTTTGALIADVNASSGTATSNISKSICIVGATVCVAMYSPSAGTILLTVPASTMTGAAETSVGTGYLSSKFSSLTLSSGTLTLVYETGVGVNSVTLNVGNATVVDGPYLIGDSVNSMESRVVAAASTLLGTRYYVVLSSTGAGATGNGATKFLVELFSGAKTSFQTSCVRATLRPTQSFISGFSAIAVLPTGDMVTSLLIGSIKTTGNSSAFASTALMSFALSGRSVMTTVANGQLLIAGGTVMAFDGSRCVEVGFTSAPPSVSSFTGGTSGNMTPSSTYFYAITWGYQDAAGATWESAPRYLGSVSTSSTQNSFTLNGIPSLAFTQKAAAPTNGNPGYPGTYWVNVYRSIPSGTTSYLVDRVAGGAASYTDTTGDTILQTRAQLYSQTGNQVVTNDQPPSAQCIATCGQRVWLGCDDGSLWFSKVFTEGQPVNFSVSQTFQPWNDGVPLAMTQLDQSLVIFKRHTIWVISGDGPNDQGLSGSFTSPQQIQSDCGILDPKSVVRTPSGVLFRSDRGLYLIDRSYTVQLVGKPVELVIPSTSTPGTVIGAVLLPQQSVARFVLSAKAPTSTLPDGSTLPNHVVDYDYTTGTFSEHNYALNRTGTDAPTAACLWQGAFTLSASSSGQYPAHYQEANGSWLDVYNGTSLFVSTRVQTAPIKLGGVQGYGRIWKVGVVGLTREACGLNVRLLTDYAQQSTQTPGAQSHAFSVAAQSAWRRGQYQLHVVNQKAEALSVEVWDSFPPNSSLVTGEGFVLQGIALEVAVKSGMRRLSAAQKG